MRQFICNCMTFRHNFGRRKLLRQLHMLQEPQSADSVLSLFQQLSAAAPTVIDSHVA